MLKERLLDAMYLCKAAYDYKKVPGKELITDSFETQFFKSNTDFGFIEINHLLEQINFVIRGTRGWCAWKENFDVIDEEEKSKKEGRIHDGFHEGWISLLKEGMFQKLKDLIREYPDYELSGQGHSRGAPVIENAVYDLYADIGKKFDNVYTFAGPRAGGKRFAAFMEDNFNHFRVIIPMDPVINVPPRFLGYTHIDKNVVSLDKPSYKWLKWIPSRIVKALICHRPEDYIEAIQKSI